MKISTATLIAGICLALGACGTLDRISDIGKAPDLSPIGDVTAPPAQASLARQPTYIPQPPPPALQTPPAAEVLPTSLWRTGARAFFRDQRAHTVGDILTVRIQIADRAQVDNSTRRSRSASEGAGLDNFLGLESKLDSFLPNAVSPSDLIQADSTSTTTGDGEVERSEDIDLTLAAIVTQVLPNGNLVIQGRQEVRVNFEVRELIIAGIVRPEDISPENVISHTQIAEARISYGGRGQLTDVQQARYGQQLYDILFPF